MDDDHPKPHYEGVEEWVDWWLQALNPENMVVLNEIIEVTDTQVVLSSTRRNWASLEDISIILKTAGFKGEIIDRTPTHRWEPRGVEIKAWLEENRPEFFLILDDDDDMEGLEPFFKIDSKTGLVPSDVNRVRAILS